MSRVRKVFAVACSSVMLAGVAASPASAARQSGLVNVNVEDTCIACDVNVGAAIQAAANVCPNVGVGQIAILANAASRTGSQQAVCTTQGGQDVTITQA